MKFIPTHLKDAYIIEPERLEDERGFFARTWCKEEFSINGLDPNVFQCSISFNIKRGTLRGMHLQLPPFAETKLVRCTRGAIYDVIIDLRPSSETYLQWTFAELTPDNQKTLYVPKGFAHGFQTLEDNTEIFYQISESYAPEHARGIRWNETIFNIDWPEPVSLMSRRDQEYEDFIPADFLALDIF
ncbi:dTDP-4-dehydrorhamnose 3,5-epimerase [Leptothoe sp. PORK10 BA2]|uniref:dTDP-4-dehydrorhamnose 3,5-epimerase n=1 Tax=Leptothoe sp. PORK10 BA2 TaxID=3110254 RepID=UPI002B1FA85E|nr:dTDP-4-dehydrorhamnose 3,5-epimerase [Leptothoe sp. PORK10 BA2]MEA5463764.1 dTDP-4-dehydrorhamnose 3,5-epimerase [Leptothoe sp. PORK10 BA2]